MAIGEPTIGIDLGTTNSVVAVIEGETPQIIVNAEGQTKTPSTVAFLESGEIVAGEIARRQSATQPTRTISSVKRLLGRMKHELDEDAEVYPFEIGEDEEGRATIVVDGQAYSPQQISAYVLEKLKHSAEDHFDQPIHNAIITVPAYFDDIQRQATMEAARMAGLQVLRLINEPTAAAMAYGLGKNCQETVAIYDFGGGTFDFSVLDIDDNTFEVVLSTGNSRLGGDDLDMALVDFVADRFLEANGIELREDYLTLRRLKDEIERAKCELSTASSTAINLPFITYREGQPFHLEETLTRDMLEEVIEPFIEESIACCRNALKDSGIRKKQINKVILVGGSTRIPLVQELVEDFFGLSPFRGVNPDEVVAVGAAMQAAVLSGALEEVVLLDVTPHTLGIEVKGDSRSILIEKNSTIPIKVSKNFTTTEDNQEFVNVHLLQGEEDKASENRSLGKFTLSGIPEAQAGTPRIQVEVFVNADGIVELSATESHSGQEKRLSTAFSYLDADERRKRQGLRSSRSRRRRRRSFAANIAEGSPARRDDGSAPSSPAASGRGGAIGRSPSNGPQAPEGGQRVVETVGSLPGEEGSVPAQLKTGAQAAPPPPASSMPAPGPRPAPPSARKPRPSAAPEPQPSAKRRRQSKAETEGEREAAPAASAEAPSTPEAPPSPEVREEDLEPVAKHAADSQVARMEKPEESDEPEVPLSTGMVDVSAIPEELKPVVQLIAEDRSDAEAGAVYASQGRNFVNYCDDQPQNHELAELKAKYLILSKQPEEARETIAKMCRDWPDRRKHYIGLLGLLCRNYPNYVAARRDRALLARDLGDLKVAMQDLEFIAKRDDSDTNVFNELSGVYSQLLEENKDATVQFKLVKVHLRRGELDEAIVLLQQLVQIAGYRERADKILGLCFWQKGLRYLALQKFKTLPLTEEIKDILYRLSKEMEDNDELLHAKYALERIYEEDIGYRDTAERLRKISYRVDLMKDERYGDLGGGNVDINAETIRESLIGDRFELQGEINRGSMGIVYRALDRSLDEVVAIKVLNDFLTSDPKAVARFKQECRSARRLSHPNIVRIHDFLDLDDRKLISMEYIEGEDLKKMLGRQVTLTEDMIYNYLRQLCDAMAYAHRLGIIHRDLKPANIMIDERNQVKVTDFGIAKVIDASATNNGTMIMGTPLYMSPEQIQGGSIDGRVDIYALGVMLYELVTGAPPFYEGNIEYQHIHNPVPDMKIAVSDTLKKIILKCVQKNPEDRYKSFEEIQAELPPE